MKLPIRRIVLTEHQRAAGIELTREEMLALRSCAPSIQIVPTSAVDKFDLTPGSVIGTINLGTVGIEIRPKLPIERVLFLVSYSLDPLRWRHTPFEYHPETSLVEAMVAAFVMLTQRVVARGLLAGYRAHDDALRTVRGRIRFEEQVRKRYALFPPVEVQYDEFTEDIEENRLLRAALSRLLELPLRSTEMYRGVRALTQAFERVELVDYHPSHLPVILYTRLNEHYRQSLELAKLILRALSIELGGRHERAATFLVDMNEVFENFVVIALREALQLSAKAFPQGGPNHVYLDALGQIRLHPDLSWWEGTRCVFVGDVKYKRLEDSGARQPDLYQLLAYTIATKTPGGLLIYPSTEARPESYRIVPVGKRLDVATLDLSGSSAYLLTQVDALATRIRAIREESLASE